jgi:uncharacterized repeat protein (TIGR03917 family)
MTLPGPKDLLTLGAPLIVWGERGITVARADHETGTFYEVVATETSTAAGLAEALAQLPPDALLRSSFSDADYICVNFWRAV